MYVLRHLSTLERVPEALQEKIFRKVSEVSELAKLSPDQVRSYQDSLKYYRDIKSSIDTAEEKGREEGRKEEKLEIAKRMLTEPQVDIATVAKVTGRTQAELEKIQTSLKSAQ